MQEQNVWDFVEKYYPDYHRCDNIARALDLQAVIDNEETDFFNSIQEEMYNTSNKIPTNEQIVERAKEIYIDLLSTRIYPEAIKAYQKKRNTAKKLLKAFSDFGRAYADIAEIWNDSSFDGNAFTEFYPFDFSMYEDLPKVMQWVNTSKETIIKTLTEE